MKNADALRFWAGSSSVAVSLTPVSKDAGAGMEKKHAQSPAELKRRFARA